MSLSFCRLRFSVAQLFCSTTTGFVTRIGVRNVSSKLSKITKKNNNIIRSYSSVVTDSKENINNNNNIPIFDLEAAKLRILSRALTLVHEHGWTAESISIACQEENLSPQSHGLFADPSFSLASFFLDRCNEKTLENVAMESFFAPESITIDKLYQALKFRLELILPLLESWPQAMATLTHPTYLSSTICKTSGLMSCILMRATDSPHTGLNGHVDRAGLSVIYMLAELHLIADTSANHEATWDFLRRVLEKGEEAKDFAAIAALYASVLPMTKVFF